MFKSGMPPYWIIILFIIADVLLRISQFIMMKKIIKFELGRYLSSVYPRILLTIAVLLAYLYVYNIVSPQGLYKIPAFIFTSVFTFSISTLIGLRKNERTKIADILKSRLKKR